MYIKNLTPLPELDLKVQIVLTNGIYLEYKVKKHEKPENSVNRNFKETVIPLQ